MTRIDTAQLIRLARLVADTANEEIDCTVFLDRVAEYLGTHHVGANPLPPEMVAVEQHLRVCPECYEEFRILLRTSRESADSEPVRRTSPDPGKNSRPHRD